LERLVCPLASPGTSLQGSAATAAKSNNLVMARSDDVDAGRTWAALVRLRLVRHRHL